MTATNSVGTDTVTILITVTDITTVPAVKNTTLSVQEDAASTGKLVSDTGTSYAIVTQPVDGTLVLNSATGDFTYTPNTKYIGTDSFTWTATNKIGTSAVVKVAITVAVPPGVGIRNEVLALGMAVAFIDYTVPPLEDQLVGVAWNFGDSTNGFGADGRHLYAAAGTYTITGSVSYGGTVDRIDPFGPVTVQIVDTANG